MRRSPLAASAALVLLIGLAIALVAFPASGSAQPSERIVFDATIMAIPPSTNALCMRLEDGELTVRAMLTGDREPQPTVLQITGYQEAEAVIGATLAVEGTEVSTTLPLKGGIWCWSIEVSPPTDLSGADIAQRSFYVQYVAVTMTLTPK